VSIIISSRHFSSLAKKSQRNFYYFFLFNETEPKSKNIRVLVQTKKIRPKQRFFFAFDSQKNQNQKQKMANADRLLFSTDSEIRLLDPWTGRTSLLARLPHVISSTASGPESVFALAGLFLFAIDIKTGKHMKIGLLPKTTNAQLVFGGDHLLAVGGIDFETGQSSKAVYEFDDGRWNDFPHMSFARDQTCSAVANDEAIYVSGGGCLGSATVEMFEFKTKKWSSLWNPHDGRSTIVKSCLFKGERLCLMDWRSGFFEVEPSLGIWYKPLAPSVLDGAFLAGTTTALYLISLAEEAIFVFEGFQWRRISNFVALPLCSVFA